jgi:endonuclease/exonuclease/phosphatase family metal-dependent hydrolase
MAEASVRIATYNLHDCVGTDGRYDPERTLAVLRELDADVLALQELRWSPDEALHLLDRFAKTLGYRAEPGPTLLDRTGHFGNALLTRLATVAVQRVDISVPGREPRGALDTILAGGRGELRVIATHLGLRPFERRRQIGELLTLLGTGDPGMPTVLMGDLNEWYLWGRPLRWLRRYFPRAPSPATYPASLPMLALDRIWVHPRNALKSIWVHRTPLSRLASDHLPLGAVLAIKTRASSKSLPGSEKLIGPHRSDVDIPA